MITTLEAPAKRAYPDAWRGRTNKHGVVFEGNECIYDVNASGAFPPWVDPDDVLPALAYTVGQPLEIVRYSSDCAALMIVNAVHGPVVYRDRFSGEIQQSFPNGFIDYHPPGHPEDHLYHPPLYVVRPSKQRAPPDRSGQFSLFGQGVTP